MQAYLDLVKDILENGEDRQDRTGVGTRSIFGTQTKYDLRKGFPLLTTKKVLFSGIVRELLWFLKGSTNINEGLTEYTPIWDAWADDEGNLGPIYGHQWRNWGGLGIDQIRNAMNEIKNNPNSRRIIVNAWNVGDLPNMKLPPCHLLFQFYVVNGRLDCQLYQRSADVALGVPYNIASYALLMMMMAKSAGLEAGIFTHTIGDAHLYLNHLDGVERQLQRDTFDLPQVTISDKDIDDITFEDIELHNYEHHPFIKFEVAV